jgi:methionine synthase II (cobalamin-independent)
VFSTLLGTLPPASEGIDPSSEDAVRQRLSELETIGLDVLTDGLPPASAQIAASEVVERWRRAAALTDRPVKAVLQGPYSAAVGIGGSPEAIGRTLRGTVAALAEAGCPLIEIDESAALAIVVDAGQRAQFVAAHRSLTASAPAAPATHRSLAMNGGNFDVAGPATFFDLPYASYAFDLIAGPDNWRLVTAAPPERGIVCGAISPASDGDESKELLIWAASYAAASSGRGMDRIGLANAPGLEAGPWDVARRKLQVVTRAAELLALGDPELIKARMDPRAVDARSAALGRYEPRSRSKRTD